MPITTTTLQDFITRVANRLDDAAGVFWTQAELMELVNEALLTWEALSGYTIQTLEISLEQGRLDYTIPTTTTYSDTDLSTSVKASLLEVAAHYPDLTAMLEGASQNSRYLFQRLTGTIVTKRQIDAGSSFIALGNSHIAPIHIDWLPYARSWQRRLNPMDAQQLDWSDAAGKPYAYSVEAQNKQMLRLIPPPDELGAIELYELAHTTEIPLALRWALKWGVLAQMLIADGQMRDHARAEYCQQRWNDATVLAKGLGLVRNCAINEQPVRTTSLADLSAHDILWRFTQGASKLVAFVGWNRLVVYKSPNVTVTPLTLKLEVYLPQAPMTELGDYLPITQEFESLIEDFTIHLALFKVSGAEFAATIPAYKALIEAAVAYNARLAPLLPALSVTKSNSQRERRDRPQEAQIDDETTR